MFYDLVDRKELIKLLAGLVEKHTHTSVYQAGQGAYKTSDVHAVRAETYERVIRILEGKND